MQPFRNAGTEIANLIREQRLREAVLLFVCEPSSDQFKPLRRLSSQEWRRLLHWLDISGLALYLIACLDDLELCDMLPQPIVHRLRQNMVDNKRRANSMVEESVAIQREFQSSGFAYAVLKGISLSPVPVPRPELRHQFDLDYLVAETSVHQAQRILQRRGYRLYCASGTSWEFKVNETANIPMRDFYKEQPSFAVELHLESDAGPQPSRLNRVKHRAMYGMLMPVLSPVDLFLGQGLHAFKDVCSAFSRTAHLLEFYRNVRSRSDDAAFWKELRETAGGDPRATLGIGVVTSLLSSMMGNFAPEALTSWTVQALPPSVRLWIELYGRRAALSNHPGTKFYLLLQKELEIAGVSGRRPLRRSLLPTGLPPAVLRASPHEALLTRIARYQLQTRFFLSRLRFHLVEGARYARESHRWRRRLERLSS
jgi:hypothetical protein